ncbi:hypothetical protein GTZ99_12115 [Novosphingobium sp. FSY-8]|uniref:Uncharacterized protein n=1 Tax=Novosphingobium ovatum TaxID=1908523 RepID=A0ABW9XFI4_9SPHN|nr:hypothetical protein [Novosphingobium ovatum]NBC37300.1 hypothetical protein [Novosphingobium ovatum]
MWQDVSPTGAISDFLLVWRSAGRDRWWFLALAALATFAIFSLIIQEEHRAPPRAPSITYINSWRADRSDEEIKASNKENQWIKDQVAAERAQAEEETRKLYETLGRISGMDVDKIKRDAAAEKAREAAAAKGQAQHDANVRGGAGAAVSAGR